MKNSGTNGDIEVVGSEIVGMIQVQGSGLMCLLLDFNPSTWIGTRIARMVPLFETYKIMSLQVTYIPTCPTTTSGMVFMYYDRDPNDPPVPPVNSAAVISRLMSNQHAVVGQAWRPVTLNYQTSPSDANSYYAAPVTDSGDLRLTSQGMVYGYNTAANAALLGGLFKVTYRLKLMTPTGPTAVASSYTGFSWVLWLHLGRPEHHHTVLPCHYWSIIAV